MMKKKNLLMVVAVVFSFALSATSGEQMEVNQNNDVRRVTQQEDIWRPLTREEMLAFESPGTKVPINPVGDIKRKNFFKILVVERYDEVMVFNPADNKLSAIQESGERIIEEKYALYVVLLLMAISLMALSNIAKWKRNSNNELATFALALAVLAALAAILAVAFSAFSAFSAALAAAAALAAILAAANVDSNIRKLYKIAAAMFYAAAIIAIFL